MAAVPKTSLAAVLASVPIRRALEAAAPVVLTSSAEGMDPQLLVLSADTQPALEEASLQLRDFLAVNQVEMGELAHALQQGSGHGPYRRALACSGREDALMALAEKRSKRVLSSHVPGTQCSTVFLLPGIGDHYVGMGHGLYMALDVFRDTVDQCARILERQLGVDIRHILYPPSQSWKQTPPTEGVDLKRMLGRAADEPPDDDAIRLNTTFFSQPALFTIEYAMACQWMSLGVTPTAIIGHSMGEYVAACLAGVLSLEDALRLIAVRARLVNELPQAVMLSVMLTEEELLPQLPSDLSVSLINGPSHCVVAGPPDSVGPFERMLTERGVIARRVQNGHAFHTRLMQPVLHEFEAEVGKTPLNPPRIPYISNVTGTWITPSDATDPTYWVRHLTRTARFSVALHALWQLPDPVMIECGPGRTLTVLANQHPGRKGPLRGAITPIRQRYENETDMQVLLGAVGRTWLVGTAIRWEALGRQNVVFASPPSSAWSAPPSLSDSLNPASHPATSEIASSTDDAVVTEREKELLAIWSRALGRDAIGVRDGFGALGGDSLSSIAAIMEMKRAGVPDELARGIYRDLTVRDIATQEAKTGSVKGGGWLQPSLIETPIFIRAAAIFIVVAGHLGLINLSGAITLMVVSGLSFGNFQLKAIEKENGVRPIFRLMLKIGVPTLLWVMLSQVTFHAVRPQSWLFYDNWIDPYLDRHFGSPYFIDLLLQNLLIIAIALSFPRVRGLAVQKPYTFSVAFLAAAWLANVIVPFFWNTEYLYGRVPHMWLWLFAFGWCAACSVTSKEKLLSSAAVVFFSAINYYLGHGIPWYATVAAVCITWLEVIPLRLPRVAIPIVTGAAGASLFIYLTDFAFNSLLRHLFGFWMGGHLPVPAWLSVAFAMAGGFVVWRIWNFVSRLSLQQLRRFGVSLVDVRIRPTDPGM